MRSLYRACLLAGLVALALALSQDGAVQGQGKKKGESKSVTFKSFDGVELSGTFYPSAGAKKDAVVMLLHHFDLKEGGSSAADGWGDLAASLQRDGYAVLAFDFRGFGGSTNVDAESFWKHGHNNGPGSIRRRGKAPATIDHKDFSPAYLRYLVNDIAAAKAFLDRRNDSREVNTSNLVLIGAGEGATLGALWLANECRRRKDKNPVAPGVPGMLGDPEVRDVAGAIWLSISPEIGKSNVSRALPKWLAEAGRSNKVPMYFLFGQKDSKGDQLARTLLRAIKPDLPKSKSPKDKKGTKDKGKGSDSLENTGLKPVSDTRFVGSKLLDRDLETGRLIKQYLDLVMESRSREWVERKVEGNQYFYTLPGSLRVLRINKPAGVEAPAVDVKLFLP